MPETYAQPLVEITTAVLEQLAFFFPVEADGPPPAGTGDGLVGVDFAGPLEGRLLVRFSEGALPEFAMNMLGTDETPDVCRQRDALGELANVICGNVLPHIAGAMAIFSLSAPVHYASWDDARSGITLDAAHAAVRFDTGRADVVLCLR